MGLLLGESPGDLQRDEGLTGFAGCDELAAVVDSKALHCSINRLVLVGAELLIFT